MTNEGGHKAILVAGLGRYANAAPSETAKFGSTDEVVRKVAANVEKAREAGFDCTVFEMNPNDQVGTVQMLKRELEAHHWDGFSMGSGIRGNMAYSELFEVAVNASREISSGTKLLFPTGPDKIYEAISRGFEDRVNSKCQ